MGRTRADPGRGTQRRSHSNPNTQGLPCGLVRRVVLEMGRRLADAGALPDERDVSFLRLEELQPALQGRLIGETADARVRRRRAELAWTLAHPGALVHGPPPVPDPDIRGMPAPARHFMNAMIWSMKHELGHPEAAVDGNGVMTGVAVSPGRYTGPARVVKSERELARLRPGEVLVCPSAHSSWTVVFGHVAALVADGGGMLSHPAIIAREHNIPAVLATGIATSTIKDGDIVTVDGTAGRVEIGT